MKKTTNKEQIKEFDLGKGDEMFGLVKIIKMKGAKPSIIEWNGEQYILNHRDQYKQQKQQKMNNGGKQK